MARFLGAPVLDQEFLSACLRFTADPADVVPLPLRNAWLAALNDSDFAKTWNPLFASLNPGQSLRILFETLSQSPKPFFHAGIDGVTTGPFDVLFDQLRDESVMLGQAKKSGARTFYDVWASYKDPASSAAGVAFRALRYSIETSILANTSLEAKTEVRLRAETSGERLLVFQLSRMLSVDEVTGARGGALTYCLNEGMSLHHRSTRGHHPLYVVLPPTPPAAAQFPLPSPLPPTPTS